MYFNLKNSLFYFIFFISIIYNLANIYSIDKTYNNIDKINNEHKIIKGEALKYWKSADKSNQDWLKVNDNYRNAYLYPKILFTLSKLFNFDFYDKNKNISLDSKLFIFFSQYIIFIFSILTFYKICNQYFDVNHLKILVLYLILDPNINQHHFAVFSESIFLSLLILHLSFFIHFSLNDFKLNKFEFLKLFFCGFLLGLMFLTRSVSIYYIIIVVLILIIFKKFYNILPLIAGYSLIIIFIGLNNSLVNGKFQITPTQGGGDAIYGYLATDIYAYKNNLSISESRKLFFEEKVRNYLGMTEYQFEIYKKNSTMKDVLQINKFKSEEAIKIIFKDPLSSIKILTFHYTKSLLIHPFWVKNLYNKKYVARGDYDDTNLNLSFQNKIRIIYSLIFYAFALGGFFLSIKNFNWKLNIILILTIVYYYAVSGFVGNPRYFLPSYLVICFYLTFFINYCFLKIFIKKNNLNKL